MPKLIETNKPEDILPVYRDTPVEELLRYHNFREPRPTDNETPKMFIAMCIDFRKFLVVPNDYAYIMRTAGARLRGNEFELLYAIAVGGVSTVVLIGHTDCGMTRVINQRDQFVTGLGERAGVSEETASEIFDTFAPEYAIEDPVKAMVAEAIMLRGLLKGVMIAPLLYRVNDDKLVQILEPGAIGLS
ncbi:MAG: carbonic anhydrase [Thermomicrobiales bacterium]